MKERMNQDKDSVCCNHNCNQGRTCPVRLGTHKPTEAMHQIDEPAATPWKDHRTAALVNDLRDCAKTYGNTQQLRERIANIVAPLCDQLKAAELAAVQQGVQPAVPMDMRLVPAEFVRGFGDLAHNYSLAAVAPDHYHGVERDAFSAAYKRCGNDLAKLREILTAAPAHPAEGVPVQVVELEVDDLIDRLLNAQQDLNLAANVHMDQSIASASTLLDEVEIALRALAANQPAAQGMDANDAEMFWDDDDSEQQYGSIEEFLNNEICNGNLDVGSIRTMQRGIRLPNIAIRVTAIDEEESEATYEIIDATLAAQAKQGGV